MKSIKTILLVLLIYPSLSFGKSISFKDALDNIRKHPQISAINHKANSLESMAKVAGSWGAPTFKVAAKNFPSDSYDSTKTPMTGVEYSISQKLSFSTSFSKKERAMLLASESAGFESKLKVQEMAASLWSLLISKRRLKETVKIYEENLKWLSNTYNVSKKLYSSGKISQQALLEFQIRISSLETEIRNTNFQIEEVDESLSYLIGADLKIDLKTVPWDSLLTTTKVNDYEESSLVKQVASQDSLISSQALSFLPDPMISIGYTKREFEDGLGDFLSAAISFPLPISSKDFGLYEKAISDRSIAQMKLEDYKLKKKFLVKKSLIKLKKISSEVATLESSSIVFAENAKKITSKSYSLGEASYVELLQSELKLRDLQIRKISLEAEKLNTATELKRISGANLI